MPAMRAALRPASVAVAAVAAFGLSACLPGGADPQPALSASPNPLVLSAQVGGPDDTGSVTITNTGTDSTNPLVVTPLGSFVPTTDTCTGAVLAPTDTCELGFTYPAADGLEQRDSSVLVSSPGDAVLVNVRVEGTTSDLA
jgi:hypothetical protein